MGEALFANLAGLWKYREGSWRIIVRIEDKRLLVLRIGHRSKVYQASVCWACCGRWPFPCVGVCGRCSIHRNIVWFRIVVGSGG